MSVTGKQTVRDRNVQGKRVLVRADFNVPLDGGRVLDDTRVRATLPTIRYLLENGAAVVLMSHLGRPKGKPVAGLSLRPVARLLGEMLGQEAAFAPDCIGPKAGSVTQKTRPGQVALLENVRFHPGDEANSPEMARDLAGHGELYVNDAFGAAHRAHASTSGVAAHLPAVAGLLMEAELRELGRLLENPARPFLVILGGAKVSDKLGVISSLLQRCDVLALGGGMANTFLAANGHDLGRSLVESGLIPRAGDLLAMAAQRGVKVILPVDLVVASRPQAGEPSSVALVESVPPDMGAYDIGPASVKAIAEAAGRAATIFWNGTVGVYEVPEFARGTAAVAEAIAAAAAGGAVAVGAGGDSLAAVQASGVAQRFTHLSTGGGASLELLEGRPLPGVECLLDRE
jgi:phosphoglycerate kinase